CLTRLRDMGKAVDEVRQAVQILPKRMMFRGNLAAYSDYAGDFKSAEQEARGVQQPTDLITLGLAFAQLGQGLLPGAAETYRKLGAISARGTSWAASGLGDLALYEGRFSEAARIFEEGAAVDLERKFGERAARKFAAVGYAQLLRGQNSRAI